MSSQVPAAPVRREDRDVEHNFLPDFAWAAVGGGAALAACVLIFMLAASWGGLLPGPPLPGGAAPSISMYYRELAGALLAGFLVVLVARSLSARTR